MSTELVVRRTCDACGASSDDEAAVSTITWIWAGSSYDVELCQPCRVQTETGLSHLIEISRSSNQPIVKASKKIPCDVCGEKFTARGMARHKFIHKRKSRKSA